MNTNELRKVFEHRLTKFDHLLRNHSSDLEEAQRHQMVGAMNEISVLLKTLQSK